VRQALRRAQPQHRRDGGGEGEDTEENKVTRQNLVHEVLTRGSLKNGNKRSNRNRTPTYRQGARSYRRIEEEEEDEEEEIEEEIEEEEEETQRQSSAYSQ